MSILATAFGLKLISSVSNLAPGGWFEVIECKSRPTLYPPRVRTETIQIVRMRMDSDKDIDWNTTTIQYLTRLFVQALHLIGKQAEVAHLHRGWMIEAGFVNVTERLERIPSNPWPKDKKLKELGYYHMHNLVDAMDAYGLAPLTRILGMERVEAEVLIAGARAEIRNRKNHYYSVV